MEATSAGSRKRQAFTTAAQVEPYSRAALLAQESTQGRIWLGFSTCVACRNCGEHSGRELAGVSKELHYYRGAAKSAGLLNHTATTSRLVAFDVRTA